MSNHPLEGLDKVVHSPARLMILSLLYVVEQADMVFVARQTGLTWGNLSSHVSKLEQAGYVAVEKGYADRRPTTTLALTDLGRQALRGWRDQIRALLDSLD